MNKKCIAFIICVNDEHEFQEALNYIDALNVPEGYSTDVIVVREAPSMAAGYNAAMQSSDAKYKIYIHQDVFLIYKELLRDLISLFQSDDQIGMVGVLGCRVLPQNAHVMERWDTGKVLSNGIPNYTNRYEEKNGTQYSDVMAIDGMFMATQYDLPWREDLFDGWDFYDISQAGEFIRAGKKVIVPYQQEYWTMHDNKASNLKKYDVYRKVFIQNYQDICPMQYEKKQFNSQQEYEAVKQETYKMLTQMIEQGEIEQVCEVFINPENQGHLVLREIELICKIYIGEKKGQFQPYFYNTDMSYQDLYFHFVELRHLLQRIEFAYGNIEENFQIILQEYSIYAVVVMLLTFAIDRKRLYRYLFNLYKKSDASKYEEFVLYRGYFDEKVSEQRFIKSEKNANGKVEKRKLVILNKLNDKIWNTFLNQYDAENVDIFVEKIDKSFNMNQIKYSKVLKGTIVNLTYQEQDKIYNNYCMVEIHGSNLEEYVKIFHNTNISVRWHVGSDYNNTITYSPNIRIEYSNELMH